jgi:hypothetical protein
MAMAVVIDTAAAIDETAAKTVTAPATGAATMFATNATGTT